MLSQDNTLSATTLAQRIGITPKAVKKQIAILKANSSNGSPRAQNFIHSPPEPRLLGFRFLGKSILLGDIGMFLAYAYCLSLENTSVKAIYKFKVNLHLG